LPATVEYKSSVERDLRRIDKKDVNRILNKIEKILGENPNKGEPLKGEYKGLYKLRIGESKHTVDNIFSSPAPSIRGRASAQARNGVVEGLGIIS